MKLYKKIFYVTLAIAVLLTLILAGKHLLFLFFSVVGLWLASNTNEKETKVEEEVSTAQQIQTELLDQADQLKIRSGQVKESSKARREGRYKKTSLLLIILVALRALVVDPVLAADDLLYIPASYEELRDLYIMADQEVRERDELISQYQALIEDYEKSLRELNILVTLLQEISREKDVAIAVKDELITLNKKAGWGVTGVLMVGDKFGYTVGLIRVEDWWGWQINYSPAGLLSLGLSIYL